MYCTDCNNPINACNCWGFVNRSTLRQKQAERETEQKAQAYKWAAANNYAIVPTKLLRALDDLVIECKDEQPMDSEPLDKLHKRIAAVEVSDAGHHQNIKSDL
jgi:hypothetical protein